MALQITTNINVDFYDNKYIIINAKQYDDMSRLISVTCYNQGDIFNLSANKHTAYIKFRKSDGHWILNSCPINYKGQILIELTEQMLAASGICYVDILVVNKGSAIVNYDTCTITTIDNSSVLTTKAFYIDVQEGVIDNSLVESSDGYDGLTGLMERVEADYQDIILGAKSYAIGTKNVARENDEEDNSKYYSQISKSYTMGGTGLRTGENTNNSKYYSEQAQNSANAADESEANALSYMNTTKTHKDASETAQSAAETAQSKAEIAQSKAEVAQSKSEQAQDIAEKAQMAAETAEQNAETAQSAAETAQSKAEIAQSKAEVAQNASEIAQQGAETARSATEIAQSAAEVAQQKAETAQSAAEVAENNAKQAAAQAAEQAAELAAQNAVNNVMSLMNNSVAASQEAATRAQSIVDGLGIATISEVKEYLSI